MSKISSGIILGFGFGVLDVLLMIPLPFEDKATAMIAAFVNRFAIGFFIPFVDIKMPAWLRGILIGVLLSVPDALITKAYGPIVGIGIVGGAVIGVISDKLVCSQKSVDSS